MRLWEGYPDGLDPGQRGFMWVCPWMVRWAIPEVGHFSRSARERGFHPARNWSGFQQSGSKTQPWPSIPALNGLADASLADGGQLHLHLVSASDGGVHSHLSHLAGLPALGAGPARIQDVCHPRQYHRWPRYPSPRRHPGSLAQDRGADRGGCGRRNQHRFCGRTGP